MKRWRALLLACIAPVAFAQTPMPGARQVDLLPGEYHLEGVMETGSGLRLHDDGTFEWFFAYGALDLQARGRWMGATNGIDLVVEDMAYPPQLPETRFERMHLRVSGTGLVPAWPWDMDAFRQGEERGMYERTDLDD